MTRIVENIEIKIQKETCSICGDDINGCGYDADPIRDKGLCCDRCNRKYVIPARIKEARNNRKARKENTMNLLDTYFAIATTDDMKTLVYELDVPDGMLLDAIGECTVHDLYRICDREFAEIPRPDETLYMTVLENPFNTTCPSVVVVNDCGDAFFLQVDDYNTYIERVILMYEDAKERRLSCD